MPFVNCDQKKKWYVHGYYFQLLSYILNFFLTKIPNSPNFSKLVTFLTPWVNHGLSK